MPIYEYRCKDCSHELEIFQKFTDDSLTVCPECEGNLRKVFSPVGIVFKGSGFYSTDNRTSKKSLTNGTKDSAANSSSSDPSSSSDSTGGETAGAASGKSNEASDSGPGSSNNNSSGAANGN